MIKVILPDNFIPERKYIIEVMLQQFLGLEFHMYFDQVQDYTLELRNGNRLIVRDHFFSNYDEAKGYLYIEHLPQKVGFISNNPFLSENDIPVLYGNDEYKGSKSEITVGIDLFASSFFMLTRWEEYVNPLRDLHERFPATASIAYKYDFLDRPIVNEYVEMLWNMLVYLGIKQPRKVRSYQMILTHDVDHIRYWKNPYTLFRSMAGEIYRNKDVMAAISQIPQFIKVQANRKNDPYDTFDWIMDISEKANVQSRFYFMSGGTTKYDNNYIVESDRSRKIIAGIINRGHIVGFHPSYNSYNDPVQWRLEKEHLEQIVGISIKEGRQHFLRFEQPTTWQIWEENGMEMDSTLSYADHEGFRCGTCYEFNVFNFLNRTKLQLKEYPLIVMEGSMVVYQKYTSSDMHDRIVELIDKVKKYNGNFVFLWHNSSFNTSFWKRYESVYVNIPF